jgi:hypothetical protein
VLALEERVAVVATDAALSARQAQDLEQKGAVKYAANSVENSWLNWGGSTNVVLKWVIGDLEGARAKAVDSKEHRALCEQLTAEATDRWAEIHNAEAAVKKDVKRLSAVDAEAMQLQRIRQRIQDASFAAAAAMKMSQNQRHGRLAPQEAQSSPGISGHDMGEESSAETLSHTMELLGQLEECVRAEQGVAALRAASR